ncbi:MAG: FAD-binding oxidoreductase [Myxococcota bacterium]
MNSNTVDGLRGLLGKDRVLDAEPGQPFDYWVLSHLGAWRGEQAALPGAVVQPTTVEEVQAVVRFAGETRTPLVPKGLGSGVCGGILPDESVVIVDLSKLNRIREIDPTNLLASFDAGVNGMDAENAVAERGLTIGHWPQSIAVSSVGGWIATRAAGQFSTAYGNMEDIMYSIEAVLPNGDLVTLGKAPRAAAGPDLRHLLLGAEGTMGIVTGATLSLRRQPERRAYSAHYTPSLAAGLEVQRSIIQSDWLPPVVRQYDPFEVSRLFGSISSGERGLLLMVHEGPSTRVEAELEAVAAIAKEGGLEPAPEEVGPLWMKDRNHVPSWTDLFEKNLIADTVEVSAPWTRIEAVYHDVVESVQALPQVLVCSAHSSHVYRTGVNLYFTFAAYHQDSADMRETYLECYRRVLEATAKNGGGISHHHGIGRIRKPFLAHDLGPNGVALLRKLKAAVDPSGLMNPGNLIPDP